MRRRQFTHDCFQDPNESGTDYKKRLEGGESSDDDDGEKAAAAAKKSAAAKKRAEQKSKGGQQQTTKASKSDERRAAAASKPPPAPRVRKPTAAEISERETAEFNARLKAMNGQVCLRNPAPRNVPSSIRHRSSS